MAKYLDERITVEFTDLTAGKVYNYFVYYNSEDTEKENIFVGNLYTESSAKTLDITDIVQNDITKRGYGQEFEYSVELNSKIKEVSVYHIYRYPHKLAKYLYKVDGFYTDCKDDDWNPILPPTYPATYTDNLQKEQYFTRNKIYYIPDAIISNGIFGNVGNQLEFPNDINIDDSIYEWAIKDLTDNGFSINIQTPYKPTYMNCYINKKGTGEQEEISEDITSFPYEFTAEGDTEQGDYFQNGYLIDFYFGDESDETRFNLYPYPFFQEDDYAIINRTENMSFAIDYKSNTLTTDKIWKDPTLQYFTKSANKIIHQNSLYEELLDTNYYVVTLRDTEGDIWHSDHIPYIDGALEIPIWDGTTNYDEYRVDFKNFKGLTVSWYNENGANLGDEEIDLDLSQCQGDVVKLAIATYKDTTAGLEYYFTCEVTDDFYDATGVFKYTTNLKREQTDIMLSQTGNYTKQTQQLAGYKIENKILNAYQVKTKYDMLAYYLDEEGTTSTANLKSVQVIVMSDNAILHNKIYNPVKGTTFTWYVQDLNGKLVHNYRAIIYAIKEDYTVSYIDYTIPGYVITAPYVQISNRAEKNPPKTVKINLFLETYTTRWENSNEVFTLNDIRYSNPLLKVTCPKGYFLQWRDRWGSLQCQPFNKVNEYSEDIEASEITNYYGKRSIYKTENQPAFKINSGWIDTDVYPVYESIFVSPTLKLYDADTDTSYDVILKDRSYTEKTFENQQHQMFNLALNLELSAKQTILY